MCVRPEWPRGSCVPLTGSGICWALCLTQEGQTPKAPQALTWGLQEVPSGRGHSSQRQTGATHSAVGRAGQEQTPRFQRPYTVPAELQSHLCPRLRQAPRDTFYRLSLTHTGPPGPGLVPGT